jgi:hypothetical protein
MLYWHEFRSVMPVENQLSVILGGAETAAEIFPFSVLFSAKPV